MRCGEPAVRSGRIPHTPPFPSFLLASSLASISTMQMSACLQPRAAVVAQARRELPAKAKGKPAPKVKTARKDGSKGGKGVDSNTGQKGSRWLRPPALAQPAPARACVSHPFPIPPLSAHHWTPVQPLSPASLAWEAWRWAMRRLAT